MSILDTIGEAAGLQKPTQASGKGDSRPIFSTTSFSRVVYWHYTKQYFGDPSNIRKDLDSKYLDVSEGVIEKEIESIEVEKSISTAAGNFSISLMPSKNWKKFLSPGDWLVIQLFRSAKALSKKNEDIVMIGNIDRVSREKQKDPKTGKTIVRYVVQGRDFGKVFQDTTIYYNPYVSETATEDLVSQLLHQKGLIMFGNPAGMCSKITDIFLSGVPVNADSIAAESGVKGGKGTINSMEQWLIPKKMIDFIGKSAASFTGEQTFHSILDQDIPSSLPGYARRVALSPGANGNLWSFLQRSANTPINDLFLDLARDSEGAVQPRITLRPRPQSVFFRDHQDAITPLEGKYFDLLDMISKTVEDPIEISQDEIKFDDLGRDEHSLFNQIWLNPQVANGDAAINAYANAKTGGIGLPMRMNESSRRNGLRVDRQNLDFAYTVNGPNADKQTPLYKAFLYQRYDQLAYHHLYETGTVEAVGNINAHVGGILRILPRTKKNPFAKIYYVEGYRHVWKYPSHWTTDFTVTCGQWEDRARPFIDLPEADKGRFDEDFDADSLAHTTTDHAGVKSADASGGILNSIGSVLGIG